SSTIVVSAGNSITQLMTLDDGDSFSAGAAISASSGAPVVQATGTNTVHVDASGVTPGSYGIGIAMDSGGQPGCLHVHVVDTSLCLVAVADGAWSDKATWSGNGPPTSNDCAYIPQGISVGTLSTTGTSAGAVFIENGGTLIVPLATSQQGGQPNDAFTVGLALISAGTVNCAVGGHFQPGTISGFVVPL